MPSHLLNLQLGTWNKNICVCVFLMLILRISCIRTPLYYGLRQECDPFSISALLQQEHITDDFFFKNTKIC